MIEDLNGIERVHFMGAAGIGMSALVRYLLARGVKVSGCDRDPGEQGGALTALGAAVLEGHSPDHISAADLLVVTSAVPPDHPELEEARRQGIRIIKRAELLAEIVNAGHGVAVAGTHGKTTTSSLLGHILTEAGLDPTVLVGGMSLNLGSNARLGGDLVVAEADEYDGSFLRLQPKLAVITNVEADHLDFYGSVQEVQRAFRQFAEVVQDTLLICGDDPVLPDLVQGVRAHIVSYGIAAGDWRAVHIEERSGETHLTLRHDGQEQELQTRLAGTHNVQNIAAAVAAAHYLGVRPEQAQKAVATFSGVARRLERKGESRNILVLDDYAHHPTEIRVNLAAVKNRYGRPIRAVFQPHTYTRTRAFLDEFAMSFDDADYVYLLDIYAARERDTLGITGEDLADAARLQHHDVSYTPSIEMAVDALARDSRAGDVVITMGAGDVYRTGPELLRRLENS